MYIIEPFIINKVLTFKIHVIDNQSSCYLYILIFNVRNKFISYVDNCSRKYCIVKYEKKRGRKKKKKKKKNNFHKNRNRVNETSWIIVI